MISLLLENHQPQDEFKLPLEVKYAQIRLDKPIVGNPSCLQTTATSLMSQESEQTRPHRPPKQISRVPLAGLAPLTSLISVSLHTGAMLE